MDAFCGSKFWDWNLTWFTDSPQLTPCFEETVLVWFPCLYFLVFFFVGYYQCRKSVYREIPWGWLNTTKLIGVGILLLITISDILFATLFHPSGMKMYAVDYTTGIFKNLTFILVGTLIVLFRKYGVRTSFVTLTFWLFTVICDVPHYIRQFESITDTEDDVRLYPYISNVIYFPTTLSMLLLELFVDARPLMSIHPPLKPLPVDTNVSFLNEFLALWFDGFAFRHYRGNLKLENLPGPGYHDRLQYLVQLFTGYWNAKLETSDTKGKKKDATSSGYQNTELPYTRLSSSKDVTVVSILRNCFWGSFLSSTLFKILSDIFMFITPQILRLFINYLEDDEPSWRGYVYTFGITFTCCLQSLMVNTYTFSILRVGLQARNVLMTVVFRKVLRISNGAKRIFTTGDISNLMAVDSQRFADIFLYINMVVSIPVTVTAAMYFLWDLIGVSALAGLVLLLLIVPFNLWAGNNMKKLQLLQMKCKDERVKITNEVLSGIKVLKMYAWEPSFSKKILEIRAQEIRLLKRIAYLDTAISFTWMTAPILVSLIMFATFTFIDENNILTTEIGLVSLSLFNIMKTPISLIPRFMSCLTQTAVASKRLTKFLNAEELDNDTVSHEKIKDFQILVDRGTFSWDDNGPPTLQNINLKVKKGSLVAIVGPVGSGKTSLLSAILGEMYKFEGRVNTYGTSAYVPQQAWIQNASLQDNILFMEPYQATKYTKVIEACALLPDLQVLPNGDLTEIGEKGINLSGGQKQRISLARAVYNDSEVYYLDDPLSAVDAHVGKHIFQNVIGPHGLLREKTRLLVTNAIQYLPEMDFIVVLKNGAVVESGTYDQLLSNEGEFADFITNYSLDEEIVEQKNENVITPSVINVERLISVEDVTVLNSLPDELIDNSFVFESMGEKLIAKEQTKEGKVKVEIYWYYIKAGGVLLWLATISFNILYQVLSALANVWLTTWSSDPDVATEKYYYLGGYGEFAIGIAVSVIVASLSMNFAVFNASFRLHENLLQKVLYWRAYIFDITPIGQILNRFSYDVDVLDNALAATLKQMANLGGQVLATICVIVYSSPIFLVALAPLTLLYMFIEQVYVGITRQLKRIESASRSPMYSYFNETITGAPVVRAYQMEDKFIKESEERILKNQICANTSLWAFKWICFRLDGLANMIIVAVSLLAVMYRGTQNSGILSLSITYALQLTRSLTWVIRSASDIESNTVSIERIKEFENIPVEPLDSPNYRQSIPPSWPDKGIIIFEGYKARYREELDFVLRDLNVRIETGEKVGVVGRTGAGKSSLSLSLFRMFEPAEGRIIIDGIDISEIRLNVLRSRITIIPQDPVLFSGNVRLNLDPFFEYTDEQLWRSLELAHLKNFVASLPQGLRYEISENGGNLSIGQRQLVCLARALLRKTKILVLDEATAAIDLETDELIQKTIRKEFKECTVVTIAHKLNTVMDSDRIMVLDRGLVKEFDSPAHLLEEKNSIFYGMAKEAGLVS